MNLDEKIEKVENTIKNRKIAIAFSEIGRAHV